MSQCPTCGANKEATMNNPEPAFPVQDLSKWQGHGMALRDYFAAHALQGMLAGPVQPQPGPEMYARLASIAYALADAMLAERGRA
jgi:hypothetical protein